MKNLIVITRPAADARRYKAAVEALGLSCFLEPLLRIDAGQEPVPKPKPYQGLIFTSVNGIRHFCGGEAFKGLDTYCVGTRTAEVAT